MLTEIIGRVKMFFVKRTTSPFLCKLTKVCRSPLARVSVWSVLTRYLRFKFAIFDHTQLITKGTLWLDFSASSFSQGYFAGCFFFPTSKHGSVLFLWVCAVKSQSDYGQTTYIIKMSLGGKALSQTVSDTRCVGKASVFFIDCHSAR